MGEIISLESFRKQAGKKEAPAAVQPAETDPVHVVFQELLSVLPLAGAGRQPYLRKLLATLNSDFALAAQRDTKTQYLGMYATNLTLFPAPLAPAAFDEVRESYREALKHSDPARYHRIVRRAGEEPGRLKEAFGQAVIGDSTAYRASAGLVRHVFADAVLTPVALERPGIGIIPCMKLEIPVTEGRDLRTIIERDLKIRPSAFG